MTPAADLPPRAVPTSGAEPSDHSLLRRYRRGSEDAATQLYVRYAQRLRTLAQAEVSRDLAQRLDVDDIVQSVFGSFFRGVREGDYDVPAGDELWKLFLVIALNKIRAKGAFHRAAKRDIRRTTGGSDAEQALGAAPTTDHEEYSFLQLVIEDVLEQLPEQYRVVVELRVEGYEVAEIAEKTGRSKRTVERLLQEARRKLDALLHEE